MRARIAKLASSLLVIALAAAPPSARAADIGFEDLDGGRSGIMAMPTGYAGYSWQGLDVWIRPPAPTKGMPSVFYGTVGTVSAVSQAGAVPGLSRTQRFDLKSACVSPASDWSESVDVEGWRAGVRVYVQTLRLLGGQLVSFTLDFTDVDAIRFVPGGGPVVLDELQVADRAPPPPADTTAPTVALGAVPGVPVPFTQVVITGSVTDAAQQVSGYVGSVQDAVGTTTFTVDGSGRFAAPIALAEGDNAILVQVADAAGNVGAAQVHVTSDTIRPLVGVVSPADGGVVTALALSVVANVADASATIATVDLLGPTGATLASTTVPVVAGVAAASFDAPGEGTFGVHVVATDAAGNQGDASARFVWDLSGPAVAVDVPNGARFGPLPGDLLPLNVTVVDVARSTLSAPFTAPIAIPEGGLTVQLLAPLAEGQNVISVQVVDAGGRASDLSLTVGYDTQPPAASFRSPAPGAAVRGAIEVALDASDDSGVAAVSFSVDGAPAVAAASASGPAAGSSLWGPGTGSWVASWP